MLSLHPSAEVEINVTGYAADNVKILVGCALPVDVFPLPKFHSQFVMVVPLIVVLSVNMISLFVHAFE